MSEVELDEVPVVSSDGSVELELNLNGGFGDESYVRSLCGKHQPHALATRPCPSFSNDREHARVERRLFIPLPVTGHLFPFTPGVVGGLITCLS